MQLQHTMGDEATKTPATHTSIVRNELTRNINNVLPDIHDELEQCFPEIIPFTDGMYISSNEFSTSCPTTICRMEIYYGHEKNPADRGKGQRPSVRWGPCL